MSAQNRFDPLVLDKTQKNLPSHICRESNSRYIVMDWDNVVILMSANAKAPSAAAWISVTFISKLVHFKEARKVRLFALFGVTFSGNAASARKAVKPCSKASQCNLWKPC